MATGNARAENHITTSWTRITLFTWSRLTGIARLPRSRLTPISFVKNSMCSYEKAGQPGYQDLGLYWPRASSYEPGYRDGSVSRMNFVVCSYWKFQPGYRDEKWWRDQSGVKFNEQAWRELGRIFRFYYFYKPQDSHIFTSTTKRNYSELENSRKEW